MVNGIVLNLVLTFVLGRLAAADAEIDWTGLKAELDASLAQLIPKKWLEEPVQKLCDALLARAQAALADQADEKQLATDLLAKNWTAALVDFKALLTNGWTPTDPAEQEVLKLLKSA